MTNDLPVFPADYASARTQFLAAATRANAQIWSYPITNGTTDATPLTIDVAVIKGANPNQAFVISSGLHGVEGFLGSALQLACLRALPQHGDPGFPGSLVLIHALNPFGFHHLRRCDADNIDLNRNFLLSDELYIGQPDGYRELGGLLNPTGPPVRFEAFYLRALAAICRHGFHALKATIAVGQYENPKGLFFGGRQAAQSTRIVQEHFAHWIGDARDVVHFDIHTGLGASGSLKLLLVEPPDSPELGWYVEQFGDDIIEPLAPTGGIAYAARGVMGSWLREHLTDRHYRFCAAEFGTHPALRVFAALRAENRAFQTCPPGDQRLQRAQRELVECFCPASPRWRRDVLNRGAAIIQSGQRAIADAPTALS